MKTLLEQNFDELYAQVEERVKCIQPVKQMDTFTKILMWTSLNEILIDVFGESRFMWMIDLSDTEFVVSFVDRYRLKETKQLHVQHTTAFVWPEKQTITHMTVSELESFTRLCGDHGLNKSDIARHYQKPVHWVNRLLTRRKLGRCPKDAYTPEQHSKVMRSAYKPAIEKWAPSKIKLFKTMYILKEFKLPIISAVLQKVFGCEFVKSQFDSLVPTIYALNNNAGAVAVELYINQYTVIDVQDVVIEYIDYTCNCLLSIAINDNKQLHPRIVQVLTRTAGAQRKQIYKDGRRQRVCSEQDANKIISFVEQLRGIKETILMTANNACNLKNIHLLPTIPQNFDISTNKERNNKND